MDDRIKKIKRSLKYRIKPTWGSYNRLCPNCLLRQGHNLQYCCCCGTQMTTYDKNKHGKITNKQWINRALHEKEKLRRFGTLLIMLRIKNDSELNWREFEKKLLKEIGEI